MKTPCRSSRFVDRPILQSELEKVPELSFSNRSQLPVHLHKIKVVPRFDNLAVFDPRDGYADE